MRVLKGKVKIKTFGQELLILLFAIGLTAFYWRHLSFTSPLPGDAADARYTTSLYEHWYLFFTGKSSISSNFFFYPTVNTLSFSDAYLIQGIFHSTFRFFGLTILQAWLLATVAIHFVGVFSSYLLGKTLNFNFVARLLLIIFWGFNSVIWVQRGHVQNLGYSLIGYPVLFSILWYRTRYETKSKWYLWIAGVSAIAIGLSSAYALVFLVLIGILISFFSKLLGNSSLIKDNIFLSREKLTRNLVLVFTTFRKHFRYYFFSYVGMLPFALLFAYLYVFSADRITTRSPAEASYYSPTFSEIAEVPPNNYVFGKIVTRIFANSFPAVGERHMGFTPTFLLLFLGAVMYVLYVRKITKTNSFLLILSLAILFQEILVLRDARGFNLWYLTGARLPFFDAIRGISRIHQIQYMFGGILISAVLTQFVRNELPKLRKLKELANGKYSIGVLGFLLAICLSIGEASSYYGSWSSNEMKPIQVVNESQLDNCSAFILLPDKSQFEARPWYLWLIDAQIYATEVQVPTVSGYSGGTPSLYKLDYSSPDALNSSIEESRYLNEITDLCKLTPVEDRTAQSKWEVSKWK
jgi:hypothetical protein